MNMKYIAVFICLVGVVGAQSYTDWQQGATEGLSYGFKLGQAYQKAVNGLNIDDYNTLVDSYNAWVTENFGEGSPLLMQKMTGTSSDLDLTKAILISNNTSKGGIVHAIDGGTEGGASYTTNDMDTLPSSVTQKMYDDSKKLDPNSPEYQATQGAYLGGI